MIRQRYISRETERNRKHIYPPLENVSRYIHINVCLRRICVNDNTNRDSIAAGDSSFALAFYVSFFARVAVAVCI